jgi:metal-responsive CopG/Arc/MetJ family transcriptional regulator
MSERQSFARKSGGAAITIRLSRDLLKRIDCWIASQDGPVSRSDAIRHLAELALDNAEISSKAGTSNQGAEQAAGMASNTIDHLEDQSATREDREQRKRRLVKGPSEFREIREKEVSARRKKGSDRN